MPSEKSQTEKDKYHMYDLTYMWNLKKTNSDTENRLMIAVRSRAVGTGEGNQRYKLPVIR